MPTVHRALGLRFVVYLNDHDPAHVHVLGPDAWARIDLGVASGAVGLMDAGGFSPGHLRAILAEAQACRAVFIEAWNKHHD